MKPKLKKLAVQRETLRLLGDSELARANGGATTQTRTVDWCSTESQSKCYGGPETRCLQLK
jgi:hypothetical protein